VEPDYEQVEVGVVAGGAHGVDQYDQLVIGQGAAPAAGPPWLGEDLGWVRGYEAFGGCPGEQCSQRGDAGLS
jgi:hypothetical protein